MIRIAIVDDQMLVRQGIRALLELLPDLEVALEARDGVEALSLLATTPVDVVLLDVRMPRLDGLGVIRDLARRPSAPHAIVLTTFDDDDVLLAMVRAGAKGWLLKDVSLEALADAIRAVAAGRTMIRPQLTERVRADLAIPARATPSPLTARELEVLRLMAGGYSNREIADALGAAEGTIKNHASSVLAKLGVRDRTRAVLTAIERGLI
ncbi:MAG TPA: response regulator transcription factor [Kofleriaceae bacterium]|jgi:DNA-binding NarL/FixJ family response regulator